MILLGGGGIIVLCMLCLISAIYWRESVLPRGAMTRTALVELFETPITLIAITETPSDSPAEITPPASLPSETSLPSTPTATIEFSPPVFAEPPPGKIAFTCTVGDRDQICLMNADGSERAQLTSTNANSFYPSVAPDGTSVVYSSNVEGGYQLYRMDLDSKAVTRLTDGIGSLYAPEISPNGNRIVFTAEAGEQSIWLMRADGSNPRPVSRDEGIGYDPTWSPDSSRIAFASKRDGSVQLYTINANGENLRRVTRGVNGIGGRSSWSPDGETLAFYAGTAGKRNIFLIGVDGKNLRQITDGGDNLGPCYSPDGQWITFTSYRDGNNEIYVMRTDGSQVTRLTGASGADYQPRWGP